MPKPQDQEEPTIVGTTLPLLGRSSIDPEAYRLNASQLRERIAATLSENLKARGRNG